MSESFPLVRVVSTIVSTITNDVTEGLYIGDYLTLSSGTITNTSPLYNLKSGYGMELLNSTVSGTILELFAGTGISIINGTVITNTSPLSDLQSGYGLELSSSTVLGTILQLQAGNGINISNATLINNVSALADLKTGNRLAIYNSTVYSTIIGFSTSEYLSIDNSTLTNTSTINSLYKNVPYHGAYPYVAYSPYYLHPTRVGGLYLNNIIGRIVVGDNVTDLAFSPDGTKMVIITETAVMSIVDISNSSIIYTSENLSNIAGIGYNAYSGQITSNSASVIVTLNDDPSYIILLDLYKKNYGYYDVEGSGATGLVISPSGRYVYVANYDSSNVSVVDLDTQSNKTIGTPSSEPRRLTISPDGKIVYISCNTGVINVLYTETLESSILFQPENASGLFDIAITPDNKMGIVAVSQVSSGDEYLEFFGTTPPHGNNGNTISMSSMNKIAITSDGRYCYASTDNVVDIVSIYEQKIISSVPVTSPGAIKASPDCRYIAVGSGGGTVTIVLAAVPHYTIQNLTAQTTASTLIVGSLDFISAYDGIVYLKAIVRGSNDVIGDGIEVALLNGTSTLDSEIYTQEGLAGNEHTFMLSYELSVSADSSYTVMTNVSAVTGGTVSAKLVGLEIRDQYDIE